MVGSFVVRWLAACSGPTSDTTPTDQPPTDATGTSPDSGTTPEPTADTATVATGETADTGDGHATGDTGAESCAVRCDDGLTCTTETCDALGRCIAIPLYDCPWPAVDPVDATSLATIDPALTEHQSGATWNRDTRGLWLVRNAGPSGIWRLVEDGFGGWLVDTDAYGARAEWMDVGDAESLTIVDPIGAPTLLHVLDEGRSSIVAWDLSTLGADPVEREAWDLSSWLPDDDPHGAEGLTFVPDAVLAEWGFVDGTGTARTSALGMGGLMFVAHQNGGQIYVFDLAPGTTDVALVATFDTARYETSGLELDPSTGRLYLWHGGGANDLEVARLSSTDLGGLNRRLDTEYVFDHPGTGNLEGVALMGAEDCIAGGRPLFLVEDEGGDRSVLLYPDWPLGCP